MDWVATFNAMVSSWPFWMAVVVVVFMVIFRPNVAALIGKIMTIGRTGITVAAPDQRAPAAANPRAAADELLAHLDNQYVLTREEAIRKELTTRGLPEASPETAKVLIRYTAVSIITAEFESIYNNIWGSQIQILTHLNSVSAATREQVLPYYQAVATQSPTVFSVYPFENYMNFLINLGLLEAKGDVFSITLKGRTFLLYLIQVGKPLHRAF